MWKIKHLFAYLLFQQRLAAMSAKHYCLLTNVVFLSYQVVDAHMLDDVGRFCYNKNKFT